MKTSSKCILGKHHTTIQEVGCREECSCFCHMESDLYWSKQQVDSQREDERKIKAWADELDCHAWSISADGWFSVEGREEVGYNDMGRE